MVDKIGRIDGAPIFMLVTVVLVFAGACSDSDGDKDGTSDTVGEDAGGTDTTTTSAVTTDESTTTNSMTTTEESTIPTISEDAGNSTSSEGQSTGGFGIASDSGTNDSGGTDGGIVTVDSGTGTKTVEIGGTCSLTANMSGMTGMLNMIPGLEGFSSMGMNGTCQNSSEPCEGGTAAALSEMGIPVQIDPGGNCVAGLVCCIDPDQCVKVGVDMNAAIETMMDQPSMFDDNQTNRELAESFGITFSLDVTCTTSCDGMMSFAMGCPQGNTCCMQTPFDDLMGSYGSNPGNAR